MPNENEDVGTVEDLIKYRLDIALEDLDTAVRNFEAGDYRAANNRAYYAVFHAITACLVFEGKGFKSHAQTIGTFNKDFVHMGFFPKDFIKKINSLRDVRNQSDYEDYYEVLPSESEVQVKTAKEIIPVISSYIKERLQRKKEDREDVPI